MIAGPFKFLKKIQMAKILEKLHNALFHEPLDVQ